MSAVFIGLLVVLCHSSPGYSQIRTEPDSETTHHKEETRIYRNPEERREAGFGTPIFDGLTVSGLFEVEKIYKDEEFANNRTLDQDEPRSHALQLGFEAEFSDSLTAELVFEAEYENRLRTRTEEAVLKFDADDWGIEAGYQDLPFGEYYSHFITGPLLEFGETTASTLVVDYSMNDDFALFGYVFDGKTRRQDNDSDIGWGIGIEYENESESVRAGASYLSNLAESNERLLEDTNQIYVNKVPAWNAYVLLGFEHFEFTAEYVSATRSFAELESNQNRPSSYNLELAWFVTDSTQLALRLEHSREFAEQPEWQYGIAASWRINDNLIISAEYLRADYKSGFVFDDDDIELETHDQYGLLVSFEF